MRPLFHTWSVSATCWPKSETEIWASCNKWKHFEGHGEKFFFKVSMKIFRHFLPTTKKHFRWTLSVGCVAFRRNASLWRLWWLWRCHLFTGCVMALSESIINRLWFYSFTPSVKDPASCRSTLLAGFCGETWWSWQWWWLCGGWGFGYRAQQNWILSICLYLFVNATNVQPCSRFNHKWNQSLRDQWFSHPSGSLCSLRSHQGRDSWVGSG